jgi:hypothetical protein
VSEDDFVVGFGIVFFGYPFEDWCDRVLCFHCLEIGEGNGQSADLRLGSVRRVSIDGF